VLAPQEILRALRKVMDPELKMNVVEMGMIREISILEGVVEIVMICDPPFCHVRARLPSRYAKLPQWYRE